MAGRFFNYKRFHFEEAVSVWITADEMYNERDEKRMIITVESSLSFIAPVNLIRAGHGINEACRRAAPPIELRARAPGSVSRARSSVPAAVQRECSQIRNKKNQRHAKREYSPCVSRVGRRLTLETRRHPIRQPAWVETLARIASGRTKITRLIFLFVRRVIISTKRKSWWRGRALFYHFFLSALINA